MTKLQFDAAIFCLFFFSIFAAISNWASWSAYHDSYDYQYQGYANGFWAFFYAVLAIICMFYLEIYGV